MTPITSLLDERIQTTALAIKVDDRWFYNIGKAGRIQTAHCLAGAQLFMATKHGLAETAGIAERIKAKRPRATVEVQALVACQVIA